MSGVVVQVPTQAMPLTVAQGRAALQWYQFFVSLSPTAPVLFSQLPTQPFAGALLVVRDATTTTWGATIAGGGTHLVLAFWNGTVWTVAAK